MSLLFYTATFGHAPKKNGALLLGLGIFYMVMFIALYPKLKRMPLKNGSIGRLWVAGPAGLLCISFGIYVLIVGY